MPGVFDKKARETEKLKQEFEVEKAVLECKIAEFTIDLDWLKKACSSFGIEEEKAQVEQWISTMITTLGRLIKHIQASQNGLYTGWQFATGIQDLSQLGK